MPPNNFHNVSDAQLADEIGSLDAIIKATEERLAPYKDEFKRRGLTAVRGSRFVVTATTSSPKRLDTTRLKADLGDALDGYYKPAKDETRIGVKAIPQISEAAE